MSSPTGAARPMVATRLSARRSGNGRLPADGAPSEPAPTAPPPPSDPRRRSRDASPPQRLGRAKENGDLHPVAGISGVTALEPPAEVEKQGRQGKEDAVVEASVDVNEDSVSLEEPPGWLPDGWTMEVRHDSNGSIYWYYTAPVSGYTFTSKMQTLHYLFSGMEEQMLGLHGNTEDNDLYRSHTWLPYGWVIEVRAGGKKMDKMYKFYVHLPSGKRFFSKDEVLLYVNEGKITRCDMDVLCDTSSDDNVLAHVELNPDDLPNGWVKELIFRKCNDGIRKDPYYTDPVSHHVFRTLKSVLSYLQTGEISKHAYVPRRSLTDMYSFDKCTDLPQSMLKRLKIEGQTKQISLRAIVVDKQLLNGQTSNHSEGGTSAELTHQADPKGNKFGTEKATGAKGISSETTKRPRGRPRKILKHTKGSISDSNKSSVKNIKHLVVKDEVGISDDEDVLNGKTFELAEMEKHAMETLEVDSSSNLAERYLSMRKGGKLNSVTDLDLQKQENGKLTKASEKVTSSSVNKFYMRRSSNHTLPSKKG